MSAGLERPWCPVVRTLCFHLLETWVQGLDKELRSLNAWWCSQEKNTYQQGWFLWRLWGRLCPISVLYLQAVCWCPLYFFAYPMGFTGGSDSKESTCNARDLGSIAGLWRSPGEENGYPFQYSQLDKPMDTGDAGYSPWGCRVRHDRATNTLHFFIWLITMICVLIFKWRSPCGWVGVFQFPLFIRAPVMLS